MPRQQVKRWGNSLAIRIPAGIAESLRLHEDTDVEMDVHEGALFIKPAGVKVFSMAQFLQEGAARKRAQQHSPGDLADWEPLGTESGGFDDPDRNDLW